MNSIKKVLLPVELLDLSLKEQSKVDLFLGTLIIGFMVGILGGIAVLILGAPSILWLTFACILTSSVSLWLLHKVKNVTLPAIVFMYIWLFGLSLNLLLFEEALHFATPFWIITINIIVIYILGVYHSIITVSASLVLFVYYIEIGFWENLDRLHASRSMLNASYVEIAFAFLTIGYLLWLIIENNGKSDKILNEKNDELTLQNEMIKASNEEKTVMLKEIHHRVKNNLQVVTSLLRLQMEELKSDEAITKFKESINRIVAMAMIHEKMYQSEQINKINIEEYFFSLADDLKRTYGIGSELKVNMNCELENLGMKTMVPLALLLNELISNSCKHAFKNEENPQITIRLIPLENNLFELTYSDNGEWKKVKNENSLGLELIDSFCEQLDGEKYFSTNPTTYKFRISNLDY